MVRPLALKYAGVSLAMLVTLSKSAVYPGRLTVQYELAGKYISDFGVSRRHLLILLEPRTWLLVDDILALRTRAPGSLEISYTVRASNTAWRSASVSNKNIRHGILGHFQCTDSVIAENSHQTRWAVTQKMDANQLLSLF